MGSREDGSQGKGGWWNHSDPMVPLMLESEDRWKLTVLHGGCYEGKGKCGTFWGTVEGKIGSEIRY